MATMAMRASLSACTTSAANLKIWCNFRNFPSSTHSKCISSTFAATFLHSHCWTQFMKLCFFQKCLLLRSHEKKNRWKHRATRWRRPISRLIKPTERRMIPVKASSACDKSWRFLVSQVEDKMSKRIWETPSVLKKWHLLEDIDIESWNWIDIHLESERSFWNSIGTSTYLQILKLGGSRSIPKCPLPVKWA